MEIISDIKNININIETVFGPVVSIKHEFIFKAHSEGFFSLVFRFRLPAGAVVSSFEISHGSVTVSSELNYGSGDCGAELKQLGRTLYELTLKNVPGGSRSFSVIVRSTAVMESRMGGYCLDLPFYTDDNDEADIETGSNVTLTAVVSGKTERVFSPSHEYFLTSLQSNSGGVVLVSSFSSGGEFRLCVQPSGERKNIGYVSRKLGGGHYCLYALEPDFGYLESKNIKIKEYAAGTFYMMPQSVDDYHTGDPLIITLGTETGFPDRFFIEAADGGQQEIVIDEFVTVSSVETSAVFACRAIEGIYKYISWGNLAPESVIKLKKQAARLAAETGVLCPENRCVISYGSGGQSSKPVSIALKYNYNRPGAVGSNLRDPDMLSPAEAEEAAALAVGALLCCVRKDGGITTPYETSIRAAGEQSAYAAAALRAVSKAFPQFVQIAEAAETFIGECGMSAQNIPIIYDSHELKPCGLLLESMDVKELSRLLLALKYGNNVALN